MSEPKRIVINDEIAAVVNEAQTVYETEGGDVIAILPFPVDEKIAALVLLVWQCGYDKGQACGYQRGRHEVVAFIHELLGIRQKTGRLSSLIDGK